MAQPWTCSACTYQHDAEEAEFLTCALCRAERPPDVEGEEARARKRPRHEEKKDDDVEIGNSSSSSSSSSSSACALTERYSQSNGSAGGQQVVHLRKMLAERDEALVERDKELAETRDQLAEAKQEIKSLRDELEEVREQLTPEPDSAGPVSQAVDDFEDEDGHNETELNVRIARRCEQVKKVSGKAESRLTEMLRILLSFSTLVQSSTPPHSSTHYSSSSSNSAPLVVPRNFFDKINKAEDLRLISRALASRLHDLRKWHNKTKHEDNNANNPELVQLANMGDTMLAQLFNEVNRGLTQAQSELSSRLSRA